MILTIQCSPLFLKIKFSFEDKARYPSVMNVPYRMLYVTEISHYNVSQKYPKYPIFVIKFSDVSNLQGVKISVTH